MIIAIKKRVKIIFAKSCDTRPHGSTNEIKVKAYCIVFALRYAESKQDRTIETRARTYAPYNPKHIQSRNFEIVYRLLSERLTLLSSSPSLSPRFFLLDARVAPPPNVNIRTHELRIIKKEKKSEEILLVRKTRGERKKKRKRKRKNKSRDIPEYNFTIWYTHVVPGSNVVRIKT